MSKFPTGACLRWLCAKSQGMLRGRCGSRPCWLDLPSPSSCFKYGVCPSCSLLQDRVASVQQLIIVTKIQTGRRTYLILSTGQSLGLRERQGKGIHISYGTVYCPLFQSELTALAARFAPSVVSLRYLMRIKICKAGVLGRGKGVSEGAADGEDGKHNSENDQDGTFCYRPA